MTDVRQVPSLGGMGIRYTVKVRGKEVYLFEDEGRWIVEQDNGKNQGILKMQKVKQLRAYYCTVCSGGRYSG